MAAAVDGGVSDNERHALTAELQEGNGITTNSRAPAYIYAPANAGPVGKFYKTCVSTCAIGDSVSADGVHCQVRDPDALAFFGDGNDRSVPLSITWCDHALPPHALPRRVARCV